MSASGSDDSGYDDSAVNFGHEVQTQNEHEQPTHRRRRRRRRGGKRLGAGAEPGAGAGRQSTVNPCNLLYPYNRHYVNLETYCPESSPYMMTYTPQELKLIDVYLRGKQLNHKIIHIHEILNYAQQRANAKCCFTEVKSSNRCYMECRLFIGPVTFFIRTSLLRQTSRNPRSKWAEGKALCLSALATSLVSMLTSLHVSNRPGPGIHVLSVVWDKGHAD